MNPIRILILIGLFYLLFRLLIGAGKGDRGRGLGKPSDPVEIVQDVLMEDPVCRTLVPARRAITLKNNGKILYFCSDDCRSKFITSQGDQP